jgi:hypothetical protein
MLSICSHYNDVHYHNWFDAINMTQFRYTLHLAAHFEQFLTDRVTFALFLAAICHHVDHNGLNKNVHCNAKLNLAILDQLSRRSIIATRASLAAFSVHCPRHCRLLMEHLLVNS